MIGWYMDQFYYHLLRSLCNIPASVIFISFASSRFCSQASTFVNSAVCTTTSGWILCKILKTLSAVFKLIGIQLTSRRPIFLSCNPNTIEYLSRMVTVQFKTRSPLPPVIRNGPCYYSIDDFINCNVIEDVIILPSVSYHNLLLELTFKFIE